MTKLFPFFAGLALALLSYGMYQAVVAAPADPVTGDAQRIFYLQMPAAIAGALLFFGNFAASVLYLRKRSLTADAWAVALAESGLVFATVVVITGSIWTRYVSGAWWVWDMRMTTSLVLWLLYMSYLMLRHLAEGSAAPILAAVMALFAFADVPMVWVANLWFRSSSARPGLAAELDLRMKFAMMSNVIGFLALAALIAVFRYRVERAEQQVAALQRQQVAG